MIARRLRLNDTSIMFHVTRQYKYHFTSPYWYYGLTILVSHSTILVVVGLTIPVPWLDDTSITLYDVWYGLTILVSLLTTRLDDTSITLLLV